MIWIGVKKSFIVIKIFIIIGALTAIWRACGTVPLFIYYGTKWIIPEFFILFAFLLTCAVSFLIGTSFGTVGTIGIALMALAQSGGVSIPITAGAIISGAYFGDRCSPMSSSANLVAALTETNIYDNVKLMLRTVVLPFIASCIGFLVLSFFNPLLATDSPITAQLSEYFDLNVIVMIPAAIVILLTAFKCDIRLSMILSILSGSAIAFFLQHMSFVEILKCLLFGFYPEGNIISTDIISGGGLLSMVSVCVIVVIASAYSGIFEETKMLHSVEEYIEKLCLKFSLFPTMILTSIVTSALCCTQVIAMLLTCQFLNPIYKKYGLEKQTLAIDMENSVSLLPCLIPWNISVAVPIVMLSASAACIPYLLFIYAVPIFYIFTRRKTPLSKTE